MPDHKDPETSERNNDNGQTDGAGQPIGGTVIPAAAAFVGGLVGAIIGSSLD